MKPMKEAKFVPAAGAEGRASKKNIGRIYIEKMGGRVEDGYKNIWRVRDGVLDRRVDK